MPTNLSNLESKADKLDAEQSVPVDLSNLGVAVKNDAVKKMYIMLS